MVRGAKAGDGAGRPAPSELPAAERRERALAIALRLLGTRERSAVEIRQRLRQRGYDAETVTRVLDDLQSHGFQSDERFADAFTASSVRSKGLAGRRIQGELRLRGIDKETAARAATRTPEEEEATARGVAARRAAQLGRYPAETRARRLLAFLQRRGYSAELCARLVAELVEGRGP